MYNTHFSHFSTGVFRSQTEVQELSRVFPGIFDPTPTFACAELTQLSLAGLQTVEALAARDDDWDWPRADRSIASRAD